MYKRAERGTIVARVLGPRWTRHLDPGGSANPRAKTALRSLNTSHLSVLPSVIPFTSRSCHVCDVQEWRVNGSRNVRLARLKPSMYKRQIQSASNTSFAYSSRGWTPSSSINTTTSFPPPPLLLLNLLPRLPVDSSFAPENQRLRYNRSLMGPPHSPLSHFLSSPNPPLPPLICYLLVCQISG